MAREFVEVTAYGDSERVFMEMWNNYEPSRLGGELVTASAHNAMIRDNLYLGWPGEPPKTEHLACESCGSGWSEDEFHPGTCGNCGAPEGVPPVLKFANQENHIESAEAFVIGESRLDNSKYLY